MFWMSLYTKIILFVCSTFTFIPNALLVNTWLILPFPWLPLFWVAILLQPIFGLLHCHSQCACSGYPLWRKSLNSSGSCPRDIFLFLWGDFKQVDSSSLPKARSPKWINLAACGMATVKVVDSWIFFPASHKNSVSASLNIIFVCYLAKFTRVADLAASE